MRTFSVAQIVEKVKQQRDDTRFQIWVATGCTEQESETLYQLARDFSHTTIYPLESTARHVIMAYNWTDWRGDDLTKFLQRVYRDAAKMHVSPVWVIHTWASIAKH